MTLKTIHNDIQKLKKALKLVEETENYTHFEKSSSMLSLCKQINILQDKADKQIAYIKSMQ